LRNVVTCGTPCHGLSYLYRLSLAQAVFRGKLGEVLGPKL
jgi:hypothetical protein